MKNLMTHRCALTRLAREYDGRLRDTITYGNVPCFFEFNQRKIVTREGEEVIAAGILYMMADAQIDPNHPHWKVEMTSPYQRKEMQVLRIDPIDDPRTGKTHHYEVSFKEAHVIR